MLELYHILDLCKNSLNICMLPPEVDIKNTHQSFAVVTIINYVFRFGQYHSQNYLKVNFIISPKSIEYSVKMKKI